MVEIRKDVMTLGQVFTPDNIVNKMLGLRSRHGTVLEPSCGDGAFLARLGSNAIGLEVDGRFHGKNIRNMDFFDLSLESKYDTIIGNPPYVRFRDIRAATKRKLDMDRFDRRSNLYLFFIEKAIRHLKDNGELIFITPRDFLKATSARRLNNFLFEQGTITHFEDLGDTPIFRGYTPNCAIWRFEKGNFERHANVVHDFANEAGQLIFTNFENPTNASELFNVRVGAVSGDDRIFIDDKNGNREFVYSKTVSNGKTRMMIYKTKPSILTKYKARLLARGIRSFDETNWWQWGRDYFHSDDPRVYVNCKTRRPNPFFTHSCKAYDGSVLAIFPKQPGVDVKQLAIDLNNVDWQALGFVCGGRFLFTQRSLENCRLPESFKKYLPNKKSPRP